MQDNKITSDRLFVDLCPFFLSFILRTWSPVLANYSSGALGQIHERKKYLLKLESQKACLFMSINIEVDWLIDM